LRHGNRNRVEGNYFFGGDKPNGTFERSTTYTGGIRVYGTDHVIINNYMQGLKGTRWDAPITLTQGDAVDGSSSNLTKHFRAERVTIAYNTLVDNTYGIEIGFDKGGDYGKRLKDVTIANNIVTGSENNLVRYIDGNDQKGGVKWINNVMFPKGEASLMSGGPDFTSEQVAVTNPNLIQNDGLWKATETTPTLANGIPGLTISEDIDGQMRSIETAVGADHFSAGSVRYKPLTPDDVGPGADTMDDVPSPLLVLGSVSDFSYTAGSKEVSVTANISWTVSDDQDWITVTPESGENNGSLTINVEENTLPTSRTGTITVTDGRTSQVLNISQEGGPEGELIVSTETIDFERAKSEKSFSIFFYNQNGIHNSKG